MRSGWPSVSHEMITKVEEAMLDDRGMTVLELSEMIPDASTTYMLTKGSCHTHASSSSIAASDYHLSPELKKHMSGVHLRTREEKF
ncbi:hypothetical protein Trydic_g5359 [Trypoxylus dichotomus]